MTQDDIIRMALEAGGDWDDWKMTREFLVAFAKKVAAHEREECAKVCERLQPPYDGELSWYEGIVNCAAVIRARGEK